MEQLLDRTAQEKSKEQTLVEGVPNGLRADGALSQAMVCPNCGCELQGRKCKLLCMRPGCGYLVTCSEW